MKHEQTSKLLALETLHKVSKAAQLIAEVCKEINVTTSELINENSLLFALTNRKLNEL